MQSLTINHIIHAYDTMESYSEKFRGLLMKWKAIKNRTNSTCCASKDDNIYLILGQVPVTFTSIITASVLEEAQKKYIEARNLNTFTNDITDSEINEYTTFITMINTVINNKKLPKYNQDTLNENDLNEALKSAFDFNTAMSPEEETTACCMPWASAMTDQVKNPGSCYLFYNSMDEHNKKAADIWASSGVDAAVKHMVTRPDGTTRSYSEMRAMYG